MVEQTNLREVAHNEYLVRVDETNGALAAIGIIIFSYLNVIIFIV